MTGSCPVGASVCRDTHAELERLRDGIKALILKYNDPADNTRTPDYYSALFGASYDLDDLLNPNEGDPDG